MAQFPTLEWLNALGEKLNHDKNYAQIARNWEGDMIFVIEPGGPCSPASSTCRVI